MPNLGAALLYRRGVMFSDAADMTTAAIAEFMPGGIAATRYDQNRFDTHNSASTRTPSPNPTGECDDA